ncbi:MAG: Nif3-like dinuclear metal center hexameric protein [Proteobacteria bacterium]|nr:Nif3-like dinuclear metal center hexameric protein [Pseudomonadota bacterium]
MQLTVKKTIDIINSFAPFSLAENWDNSGLQAGNPDWTIQKIMISLDVTMEAMAAAKDWGADLLLTHHPLLISPEKSINFMKMPGSAICMAAKQNMSIVSAHTNLDKAINGLNDYFAKMMGMDCHEPLLKDSRPEGSSDSGQGIGRICQLPAAIPFKDLISQVKARLGLETIRMAGDLNLKVDKIALCTGSGGSLTNLFLESCANVYITGDIKYHEARQIEEHNKGLIDVGHFASEVIVVDLLKKRLQQALPSLGYDIKIKGFKKERDPFKTV